MRCTLRTRILLLVTGAILSATLLGLAAMTTLAGREVSRLVRMDAKAAGGALGQLLRERSESVRDESKLLVRQPSLKAYLQLGDRATIDDFARDFQRQLRVQSALITDRDGRLLGATETGIPAHATMTTDPGVQAALDGRDWTGVVMRGDRMMHEVAVPIIIGPEVWGAFVSFNAIDSVLAKNLTGGLSGSEIAFVKNGNVIGASVHVSGRLPTGTNVPARVAIGRHTYHALYAPLPDTDPRAGMGFVVLRSDGSTAFFSGGFGAVLTTISLAVVLLALMGGAFVARSITRPLGSVVDAAEKMKNGEWPDRLEVDRSDEIGLLQTVFNEMTSAIRTSQEQLLAGTLETIQALAAAVDAKDPYTNGHSQRVAEYASRLAEHVGLPKPEVDLIFLTGTLHDVGKIGVPDSILKKPGRLDDSERAVMEHHPAMGEEIVRKAPQLAKTLPGVRHHHERWDGRGYPDRLAGHDIPLAGRLLAVADTFDAMTSDRPYRKGMAWSVALDEIARGAGTQFDPVLAPAFVAMMQAETVPVKKAA